MTKLRDICLASARLIAIWFSILALILIAANYSAGIYLDTPAPSDRIRGARATFEHYGLPYFQRVYPGKSEAEIMQLIRDQAQVGAVYEPYAEFRPSPFISPTLNIHAEGFRLIGPDQGAWPPDKHAFNIFVFGGSMTLGSGVADSDTVPAVMQAMLRARTGHANVNVYNFGVGSFFSSQEVTYFQNKLRAGIVPDLAVFIDGPNDFYFWNGETEESPAYRAFVAGGSILGSQTPKFSWDDLPLLRFARMLRERGLHLADFAAHATEVDPAAPEPDPIYDAQYSDPPTVTDPHRIREVIDRYISNKKIAEGVAAAFHIKAYFVWQPTPLYKYDLKNHPRISIESHRRARYGYPAMAAYVKAHEMGDDFDWCADIQEDLHTPLYVDIMHYNLAGNRLVADCVVSGLLQSGIFGRAPEQHARE
jgi:hypothetical protein